MCDYSLMHVASRSAKVGDKLVSTQFQNALTRGFAAVGEPGVAVCLLPGTELAFDAKVATGRLRAYCHDAEALPKIVIDHTVAIRIPRKRQSSSEANTVGACVGSKCRFGHPSITIREWFREDGFMFEKSPAPGCTRPVGAVLS